MSRYVALVDGKAGAYGVVIPDLPGCTSGGPTIDDALRNAVEAVTLWVEDARADGEKIPPPRTAERLRDDPGVAAALADGGVLAYVPLVLDAAAGTIVRLKWCSFRQSTFVRQYLRTTGTDLVQKPETNRQKVTARLAREGWVARHGGEHDVQAPDQAGPYRGSAAQDAIFRCRASDCEAGRMAMRSP